MIALGTSAIGMRRGIADAVGLGLDNTVGRHPLSKYAQEHFADEKAPELGGIDGNICPVKSAQARYSGAGLIPFARPDGRAKLRA
ncbi:hypothetical protein Asru_0572_02 [Acidisphaera rubrifaciens HS-AP3]|uniref:Uncharacterized protein n=1 Tax=Acidisphaera rubrifaciens HS-AP3 TaxID=1231350 RepID=A0A0D6P8L0_9PROT|nr:hypothetical protein Asru_0572_02 [Acidisphaera rubrifaciens HS-AP3]